MILFFWMMVFGVFGAVGNALAADCVIVGDNAVYRIAECIENQTSLPAIQRFLGSNYAIVTDRKDGKILAVFLAEHGSKPEIISVSKENEENQDFSEPEQLPSNRIIFNDPVLIENINSAISHSSTEIISITIVVGDQEITLERKDGEAVEEALHRGLADSFRALRAYREELLNDGYGDDDPTVQLLKKSETSVERGLIGVRGLTVKEE
ncbi:hypothetical protein EPN15_01450 [Patescibacteria group bacterium]|nr:MAG: hypothetical protein EPN15_01450 [Patescibacteria group bacterium]